MIPAVTAAHGLSEATHAEVRQGEWADLSARQICRASPVRCRELLGFAVPGDQLMAW